MVFVGPAARYPSFVVGAGDDGGISVHPDFKIGHLGNFHVDGAIGCMTDVPRLAIDAAVFDGDHEIFGQKGREDVDAALPVRFRPLQFKRVYGGSIGLLLCDYTAACQQ